jgi:hypothetical protein
VGCPHTKSDAAKNAGEYNERNITKRSVRKFHVFENRKNRVECFAEAVVVASKMGMLFLIKIFRSSVLSPLVYSIFTTSKIFHKDIQNG